MSKGSFFSIIFHFLILLFMGSNLEFSRVREEQPNVIITAEIIAPIKHVTNIKQKQHKKTKKKQSHKETSKEISQTLKKDKIIQPTKKIEKEQKKDIDDILKNLEELLDEEEKQDKPQKQKIKSNKQFQDHKPMSVGVKEIIRSQLHKCWNINIAGAKDAGEISVLIDISLREDGSVISSKVLNANSYSGEKLKLFKIISNSAMRAIRKCNPLQNLPKNEYDAWKNFDFEFDLSETIY